MSDSNKNGGIEMRKQAEDRAITRQRLEGLLVNWGRYVTHGAPIGPQVPKRCGSAESEYATDPSRYVWEGRAYVPRGTAEIDEDLGERVERVAVLLAEDLQRVLLMRYASNRTLVDIAMQVGMSLAQAEARLASAQVQVWELLEAGHVAA